MRAIVTGGLGFVGSWLVEALKEAGDHVAVLDNLSRPAIISGPADYVYTGTLEHGLKSLPSPAYDIIYHLASPVGPAAIKRGLDVCWQIVEGTKRVLDFAASAGAKVVLFSSPEVYGYAPPSVMFLNEDAHLEVHPPYDIRAEYPIGKIAAECMALNSGVPVQVVRPYNVVGKRQSAKGGFVIARFAEQIKQGKPLTIFYGGEQKRQFTSVHDVIRFCMMLRERWPAKNGIWNVANPTVWTVKKVAVAMLEASGVPPHTYDYAHSPSLIAYVDPIEELGNPDYRDAAEKLVDVSKANRYGWYPQLGLADIIHEVLRDVVR